MMACSARVLSRAESVVRLSPDAPQPDARPRLLAFDFLVGAGLDGEALRHLAARIRRIATVVVDLRIAARARIDGRGRGVPDILRDHGPLTLPRPGARAGQPLYY